MNRIKILKASQARAERAVEVAKLKTEKLKEIDQLKELEVIHKQNLLNSRGNKKNVINKIRKSAEAIGTYRKKQVPIDAVFDNTIAAIKGRIEREQHLESIFDYKQSSKKNNEMKRRRVAEMEDNIKEYLQKVKEKNMERMKINQYNDLRNMKIKVQKAYKKLDKLEEIERNLLSKLKNTKYVESSHIRASVKVLKSIESKQGIIY